MVGRNTDRDWERAGKSDPWYGVLADPRYRQASLTEESKEEFFRSGFEHIDHVLKKIGQWFPPEYSVNRALDFGCGVGRLVIPLAGVSRSVTGVDVSESMLREARTNCEARAIRNVEFVTADDKLSRVEGKFNLIHSFIVFQHIPVRRGERIFRTLLARLERGGICVAHFTYAKVRRAPRLGPLIKRYVPLAPNVINLLRGRSPMTPEMQMNEYDVNRLVLLMQEAHIREYHTEFTDHGGNRGIIMYSRKS